jgi:hypothetical protein
MPGAKQDQTGRHGAPGHLRGLVPMAARLLLPLPCRLRACRPYATAAAPAADKPPQKYVLNAASPKPRARRLPSENDGAKPQLPSDEQIVDQLDQLLIFGRQMPTADVWGQRVDTLGTLSASRPDSAPESHHHWSLQEKM